MQHPNLFFTAADIQNYKERLKTDEKLKAKYDGLVAGADKCLEEEIVTWEECNGRESLHANFGRLSGQANHWCDVLGTKYLIDDDERCAEKLKKMLLQFYYLILFLTKL